MSAVKMKAEIKPESLLEEIGFLSINKRLDPYVPFWAVCGQSLKCLNIRHPVLSLRIAWVGFAS